MRLTLLFLLFLACGCEGNEEAPATPVNEKVIAQSNRVEGEPTRSSVPIQPAPAPAAPVSPCMIQGDTPLQVETLRAIGTEPFWAARVEGRCVTYSHPEDQQGTRIWTRYTAGQGGGTWAGALGGKPFELRTRAEPGCSDGMSDKVYPIAVELLVHGERRQGCAEPI
jgi:uncharacterized membrane protein